MNEESFDIYLCGDGVVLLFSIRPKLIWPSGYLSFLQNIAAFIAKFAFKSVLLES